jgi:hypothetical protein
MILAIVMGTLGGLIRSLLGILKYLEAGNGERKIRFGYLAISLFVAAATGALAGALCEGDWRLAAVAGYAGSDFLDNLYKLKTRGHLFPNGNLTPP